MHLARRSSCLEKSYLPDFLKLSGRLERKEVKSMPQICGREGGSKKKRMASKKALEDEKQKEEKKALPVECLKNLPQAAELHISEK